MNIDFDFSSFLSGFNIQVIRNAAMEKGRAVLMIHPDDFPDKKLNPKEPEAVQGNEGEKEDVTNDDFCPECNIGLNNREVSLGFCQNCKAHW